MKEHTMSDVQSTTKAPRAARSTREWLDSSGSPIAEESDIGGAVHGFSYHYKPANKTFVKMFDLSKNPDEVLMLAAFGGMTLAGNVANGKDDDPQKAFSDIEARFALISSGTWVERTGIGGPRYNPETLAAAISTVKHGDASQAAVYQAKMGTKVPVRSSNGAATADMDYGAFALTNPNVKAAYDKLAGKLQAAADAL